jgi:hypothetical protein
MELEPTGLRGREDVCRWPPEGSESSGVSEGSNDEMRWLQVFDLVLSMGGGGTGSRLPASSRTGEDCLLEWADLPVT